MCDSRGVVCTERDGPGRAVASWSGSPSTRTPRGVRGTLQGRGRGCGRLHRRLGRRAARRRRHRDRWPRTRSSSRWPTRTPRSTPTRPRSTPPSWPPAAATSPTRSTTCWRSPASSAGCSMREPSRSRRGAAGGRQRAGRDRLRRRAQRGVHRAERVPRRRDQGRRGGRARGGAQGRRRASAGRRTASRRPPRCDAGPGWRWFWFGLALAAQLVALYVPRAPSEGGGHGVDKLVHAAFVRAVVWTARRVGLPAVWVVVICCRPRAAERVGPVALPAASRRVRRRRDRRPGRRRDRRCAAGPPRRPRGRRGCRREHRGDRRPDRTAAARDPQAGGPVVPRARSC